MRSRGYAFFFESLFVLHVNGFSIDEVPLTLAARVYDTSKMSLNEVRRGMTTLLSLYFEEKTNPSRFRLSRATSTDPGLVDPQNWNEYWNKKSSKGTALYDAIATLYDDVTEVPQLIRAMRWNDVYQLLEDTTDKAENVATVLSNIALKNA